MNKKEIFIVCCAFVLAIAFVLFFICYGNSKDELCKMQDGKSGKCVLRSQCNDTRYDIEVRSSNEIEVLVECGNDVNKICCPNDAEISEEARHCDDEASTNSTPTNNDRTSFTLEESNKTISNDSIDFAIKALLLNDPKLCGKDQTDRIFKGDITNPSEFPFMASLKYKRTTKMKKENSNEEFRFLCGGSLLSG